MFIRGVLGVLVGILLVGCGGDEMASLRSRQVALKQKIEDLEGTVRALRSQGVTKTQWSAIMTWASAPPSRDDKMMVAMTESGAKLHEVIGGGPTGEQFAAALYAAVQVVRALPLAREELRAIDREIASHGEKP